MSEFFLDIETIPTSDNDVLADNAARHQVPPLDLSSITAAGNIKDPTKSRWTSRSAARKAVADHEAAVAGVDRAIDEAIRKTAVDSSSAPPPTSTTRMSRRSSGSEECAATR